MRFRLRTLLFVLALGPPVLALAVLFVMRLYHVLTVVPGIKGLS
jgi:hypothetical protein